MSDAEPLLKVRGLYKNYLGVSAVAGVDLDVMAGGIVALIGPNGSGKSTTVDCLSGFQRVNGGRWWLDGHELTGKPPFRHARMGLCRTFQNVRAFDELTLVENLAVAARPSPIGTWWAAFAGTAEEKRQYEETRARALELLDVVGLATYANAPAEILSYGQRKLLAIAASIMPSPKLVILDEPVAGVNPTMIGRIEAVIRKLVGEGITLLVIEHNMEFVMRNAYRVVVLASGQIIADGSPAEVRQNQLVLDAYLGVRSKGE
jgi:branched-chain amino acid transport system ATP-binding protein